MSGLGSQGEVAKRLIDLEASITPLQQIQSSCTGALITSLITTPFDVVRVRLQAQQQAAMTKACYLMDCRCLDGVTLCYVTPEGRTHSIRFNGTVDALIKMAKFEGLGTWWKGLSPTLLMAVPATVVYYTAYDQLKFMLGFKSEQTNVLAPMLAGSLSRTLAVIGVTPLELLRTKLQSRQHYSYHQLWNAVQVSIRQKGIFSLWRGLFPTLLRDVPFSVFYWVNYEFLKHSLHSHETFSRHSQTIPLIAGGFSGATAAILTNPLDVAKTHMQVGLGESLKGHSHTLGDGSLLKVLRLVVSKYGIAGLYAGLVPRIAKIAPACAIMIFTYESFKNYFVHKNNCF